MTPREKQAWRYIYMRKRGDGVPDEDEHVAEDFEYRHNILVKEATWSEWVAARITWEVQQQHRPLELVPMEA